MPLDDLAARVARGQHGLLTHAQAITIGFTPRGIRTRLANGTWSEIRRGVYVVGGVPGSWEQAVLAVTLPFEDCWISHGTAARLLGLPGAPQIGAIEVLRPNGRYSRLDGVVPHRSTIITAADVTRHRRIPVTSVGRTIVECSARLDARRTGGMIDAAMRRRKLALEETRAAFARLASGGKRRFRSIRSALGKRLAGYDPGESDLELRALHVLVAAGLPMPVQQLRMVLNGRRRRIDLAYPELRISIELLGWEYHGGREAFDADHARSNELVAIGWRPLEFTSETTDEDMVRLVRSVMRLAA